MLGKPRRDIDLSAIGRIDPDPPGVKMQLAADPAGKKSLGPAIFGIANDRVTERSHVRAQLVSSASQGLELDPGCPISSAIDESPPGFRRETIFFVDMHLFAACAGLLGKWGIDDAFSQIGHADNDCPIEFARRPARKGLCKMPRRARTSGNDKCPRCILVETMHELGAPALVREPVEQPVEVLVSLGTALCCKAWRLVENERALILVDDHVAHERRLILGQRLAPRLHAFGTPRRTFEPGEPDFLPRFNTVSWYCALSIEAQLAGPRPARNYIETDVRTVPLEPAVEPDVIVVFANGKGTSFAHRRALSEC